MGQSLIGSCFSCSVNLSFTDRVGLREECPKCRSDVHVCKNCQFFDPKKYNECAEPQAERVQTKDRSNRCEFFRLGAQGGSAENERDKLRAQADALFKKRN